MTEQEKVREEVARWLFTFVRKRDDMKYGWEEMKSYYLQEADLLLSLLHSQGLVVKVEKEMPIWLEVTLHYKDGGYICDEEALAEAGYTQVESIRQKDKEKV